MLTALLYLVVMAAVAAVVYLFATLVFGRGEEMAPLAPGATPTALPESGVTGDDVRHLRFQQTVRGYKMTEVDWALRRLAGEIDMLRGRVAELEGRPEPQPAAHTTTIERDRYEPAAFDGPPRDEDQR